MSQQNLVILSVSAGAGHVRAAEALKITAQQYYSNITTTHIDLMTLVSERFRKLYADSYIKVVERHPTLWSYLYKMSDRQKPDSALNQMRRLLERLNTRKFESTLAELQPDHVICTHFLPAELLARLVRKKLFNKPVWVQVTDFDIHSMWIHSHMSGYFAADAEVAWRMQDRGINHQQIHITGIPIMPVFGQKLDRVVCAQELGVDPHKITLLMMSGGVGLEGIEKLATRLLQLSSDFQIIALAGRNEKMLQTLKDMATQYPNRLFPMGFTTVIERIMAAADIAITKSGGLTTSECLAVGLPMIVVSPIPGQEERNADYLLEHGVALKAYDVAGLEYRVKFLIEHPQRLAEMRHRLQGLGKPEAAQSVLRIVLGS